MYLCSNVPTFFIKKYLCKYKRNKEIKKIRKNKYNHNMYVLKNDIMNTKMPLRLTFNILNV